MSRFVQLHFPADADLERILTELREHSAIARAIAYKGFIPARAQPPPFDPLVGQSDQLVFNNDLNCSFQWYLFRCNVPEAWQRATGQNVVIADVDTGFNVKHQDLVANIEIQQAYNSVSDIRGANALPLGQDMEHGTGVLGIAGGAMNGLGMAGVAFNAKLWPIEAKVGIGPDQPADPTEPIGNAIDWLRLNAPRDRRVIILVEFQMEPTEGNIEQVPSVSKAIELAIAAGFVVCVAAGNGNRDAGLDDGTNTPFEPTGSILVAATGFAANGNPQAVFPSPIPGNPPTEASNFGATITVCAPGDPSQDPTADGSDIQGYTDQFGGTSGAAAKVAGVIALMLEANPRLTHAQVKQILSETGTKLNPDPPLGVFLNAAAAVNAAFSFAA